jgi:hypothetical protein
VTESKNLKFTESMTPNAMPFSLCQKSQTIGLEAEVAPWYILFSSYSNFVKNLKSGNMKKINIVHIKIGRSGLRHGGSHL